MFVYVYNFVFLELFSLSSHEMVRPLGVKRACSASQEILVGASVGRVNFNVFNVIFESIHFIFDCKQMSLRLCSGHILTVGYEPE